MKLTDLLLFPKSLYKRLTAKKPALFFGFLFVGVADIIFSIAFDEFKVFTGKSQETLTYNILVFAAAVVVLGLLDVVCFSLPLADLFKLFKKENELDGQSGALVKIMKIYILSHFIIVPVETLVYTAILKNVTNTGVTYFIGLLFLLLPIWYCAAITRGVNTVYNFQPLFKWLVFPVVYIWSYILGNVLSYAVEHWIMALFK